MRRIPTFVFGVLLLLIVCVVRAPLVLAATQPLAGSAGVVNTSGALHFSDHGSNVAVDTETGDMSGYAWSDDLGWVAFGTDDNDQGPVMVNLTTGALTGQAQVLSTLGYLDFSNFGSNVIVDLDSGVFSGFVWSEDVGWINFGDPGVTTGQLATVTPVTSTTSSPHNPAPTLPPELQKRLDDGYDVNGECVMQKPGGMPEIFQIDMSDTKATLYIKPPTKPYTTFTISYQEVAGFTSVFTHPVFATTEHAIDFSHPDDGGVVVYTINDLTPHTQYAFKVKCANKCASTSYGTTATGTTQPQGVSTVKTYLVSATSASSAVSSLLTQTGVPAFYAILMGVFLLTAGIYTYQSTPRHYRRPLYTVKNPRRLRWRKERMKTA